MRSATRPPSVLVQNFEASPNGAVGVVSVALHLDLAAGRKRLVEDFERALRERQFPARVLDPRIFEAVQAKQRNPSVSYESLAVQFFGKPSRADAIRRWYNRFSEWKRASASA